MHMLGQMIQMAGADHVLWGTDSIWGGSPQSQIERLRRLKIKDELIEKYGYAQLTPEVKNQILGLNAAKLFGVDVAAKRQEIEHDKFSHAAAGVSEGPAAVEHAVRLGLGRSGGPVANAADRRCLAVSV